MNRIHFCRFCISCIGILFLAVPAYADCVNYDPASVTLTGVIYTHVDFGPPNYGEVPKTDSKESHIYLKLDKSICTNTKENDPLEIGESDLEALQMVYLDQSAFKKKWLNKHVSVSGTLTHAATGHHHTRVLIIPTETHTTP